MRVDPRGPVPRPDYPSAAVCKPKDAVRSQQETSACTTELSYEARLFLLVGKASAAASRQRAAKLESLHSRIAGGTYSIDRDSICDALLGDTNQGEAQCLQLTTARR
ncbi:flagellar biosynthesis anti-sigma factor FlgM [bacterium]|nr:flagellar biosynthesis anti-sigma factor FlgM [bacterium]